MRRYLLALLALALLTAPALAQQQYDPGGKGRASLYGTATKPGDTPIPADATGLHTVCVSGCAGAALPVVGGAASLAVSSVSANVAFPVSTSSFPAALLTNDGSTELFYNIGAAGVTASTSNAALLAGNQICVAIGAATNVAGVTAASTTTLRVTQLTACPTIAGGSGGGGGSGGNVNLTQVGGTAFALGQATMAGSLPVAIASNQSAVKVDGSAVTQPVSGSVSVSNFPVTQPVSGTVTANQGGTWTVQPGNTANTTAWKVDGSAVTQPVSGTVSVGNFPATQPVSAASLPLPAGASTAAKQPAIGTAGTASADVLSVQGVAAMTPLKVDGSGVTQPVSGAVSVSNFPATQPVSGTVAVSNFPATQPVSGTVAATESGTWTVQPGNTANTTAWKVDGSAVTQPVSGTVTGNQGTANTAANGWPVKVTDGTNTGAVKAASTAAAATDPSTVTQLSPNQPQLTTPLNVQGGKTNNNAAPGATNLGTLDSLANAAPPAWTEGNQVALSQDLGGNVRVYSHPPNVLGCYQVNTRTPTYTGLAIAAPLFSMRWGDATHIAIIERVQIFVVTTGTATTVGLTERELVIARSFSASDTGGTAIVLTTNNNKMRTSQGTSLVTNMQVGGPLTAGTRTLDVNAVASVAGWSPLTTVGIVIGSAGAVAGSGFIDLFNATNGQQYPIVLATNEGIIVRIGKDAMPAGATQQTYLNVNWCEASAY